MSRLLIALIFILFVWVFWKYWHVVWLKHLEAADWLPPPFGNKLYGPISLSMKPSKHFKAGSHSQPVFMLVSLPVTSVDGNTVHIDADADTGSNSLAVVTTKCQSCYCVDSACTKWPVTTGGKVNNGSQQQYGLAYEQGIYPVQYWRAHIHGMELLLAGIVGVHSGMKQVQSIVGLRPARGGNRSAASFIDTVYAALPNGLPRSLVFDPPSGQLILGQRKTGVRVALLPDSVVRDKQGSDVNWYVVQLHKPVSVDGKELEQGPSMIILDTGTSITAGHKLLRSKLRPSSSSSVISFPLTSDFSLTAPMPKGLHLFMTVAINPAFMIAGLNSVMDKCVTFDWDEQAVYFS